MKEFFFILSMLGIGLFVWLFLSLLSAFFKAVGEFFEAIGELFSGGEDPPERTYTPTSSYSHTTTSIFNYKPVKESPYTRDWSSVSRKYKESRNWRCEECYVNLYDKRNRRLLHVHHRDNDPKNNSSWNLIALCVICHSERPGAGHKRLAGAIRRDGRKQEVERLRW